MHLSYGLQNSNPNSTISSSYRGRSSFINGEPKYNLISVKAIVQLLLNWVYYSCCRFCYWSQKSQQKVLDLQAEESHEGDLDFIGPQASLPSAILPRTREATSSWLLWIHLVILH